jgi:hypothetical protein
LIALAAGVSRSWEITIGGALMPRTFANEIRVSAFARARRTSEQDQLPWKTHPAPAELSLQLPPNDAKDELRILNLQISRVRCDRRNTHRSLLTFARPNIVTLRAFHASG